VRYKNKNSRANKRKYVKSHKIRVNIGGVNAGITPDKRTIYKIRDIER